MVLGYGRDKILLVFSQDLSVCYNEYGQQEAKKKRETGQKTIVIIQARDDGGLNQGGSNRDGDNWWTLHIL